MKNLIYILFTLFTMGMVTTTFAQTCNITLDDILAIESQESFERALIENNFQRSKFEDLDWKIEAEELIKKDTLVLVYSFEGDIKHSIYPSAIMAIGVFPSKSEIDSNDTFGLMFGILYPEEEYSFYNMVFSEVKRKCTFEDVRHTGDGESTAFYSCLNAGFKGEIGFSINNEMGLIILKPSGNDGSESGDNYILLDRKALTTPKPTNDCNEEGRVYVSISVDKSGNVITAQPGVKGTTNSAACLLQRAKEAALKTKFSSDSDAPSKQVGAIVYNFSLSH